MNISLRNAVAGGFLLLMAACSRDPDVYAMPAKEAQQRLLAADFTDFRDTRQCGILIHFAASPTAEGGVKWQITSGGHDVMNFTAVLTPVEGDKTRLALEIEKDGAGLEKYGREQFYPHPALLQPVRAALREKLATILEGRPYEDRTPLDGARSSVCLIQRGRLTGGGKPFEFGPEDVAATQQPLLK
ncbi:MAG: hypothetical protein DI623_09190 [Sphingomonas sanxanigenens]|uniref:Lipoprotein n=1 Tax=Sphingomonas sanxanigenens TaxID=397260 RepID=A0A2W5C3N1_9SPHN|nr:MAG: hypothetical protein DI623_09190 [Sphingomonas sanxanigenens]